MSRPRAIFTKSALLPTGWEENVLLVWDLDGNWIDIKVGVVPPFADQSVHLTAGPVVPGIPNLHSHTFQRAFAGLTEYRSKPNDSFWSWRELMYRFALKLTPEQLETIAAWVFIEMIEAGYTSVCEFHYLHRDFDGQAYSEDDELVASLLRAAGRVGIGITLLPVLYQYGGFDRQAASREQRRFIRSTENLLNLLHGLMSKFVGPQRRLGVAPHSLRAVSPESLSELVLGISELDPNAPIHIHIAEQVSEVDACRAWSGARPVEWLLNNQPLDSRWCLVHATHMDDFECSKAAKLGVVAGLCPTTEANLGDGIFKFEQWQEEGGIWGIGSDSHVCVNPSEDLLQLEYSQRLFKHRRNIGATSSRSQVAEAMWLNAVVGGAQASGRALRGIEVGQRADFLVLDEKHSALAGLAPDMMLSCHVFASSRNSAIDGVWVGGLCCTEHGRHLLHDEAAFNFANVRQKLLENF